MLEPQRFEVNDRYVTNDERAELFDRASAVALPYVEASQSGVVPMGYAPGRAIVAARVGGLPEVIDDGLTGLLVPPRDATGLAQALIEILEDRDYGTRLGLAGRRKLERELSPAAVARKTVDTYRAALRRSEGVDRGGTPSSF